MPQAAREVRTCKTFSPGPKLSTGGDPTCSQTGSDAARACKVTVTGIAGASHPDSPGQATASVVDRPRVPAPPSWPVSNERIIRHASNRFRPPARKGHPFLRLIQYHLRIIGRNAKHAGGGRVLAYRPESSAAIASATRRPSMAALVMPPAYPAPSPQGYNPLGTSGVRGRWAW